MITRRFQAFAEGEEIKELGFCQLMKAKIKKTADF